VAWGPLWFYFFLTRPAADKERLTMFAENAIDNDVRFCAISRLLQLLVVTAGRVICTMPVEYRFYLGFYILIIPPVSVEMNNI